ncbi:GOLPH3/VPS74 family protein [Kineococcus rhizosphaerae]|uniref:Golgi phosphoprotein 3 GPP34 n=1 Tax=Kineococcus rhizosphaerae TaxID=559628 RepID=A0A2T0R5U0_9ACTN|nr:GPP34 family phosphoprotein [Kineococcus rhizosphaerae]PRY16136.1 Golgi phosphoprotein 3 GPP34 [Kineococcus rhizosphaerae]
MDTALVDDVVVLLLDPESGRPLTDATRLRAVVGGSVLLDLALRGRLVAEPTRWGQDKVEVTDASPTGDDVLDHALQRLGTRRWAAASAVTRVVDQRVGRQVRDRLAGRGALRHTPGGVLRLARDHPAAPVRDPLVAALSDAVSGTREVPPRVLALVTLVHSVGAVPKVVPGLALPRKQLAARVAKLSALLTEGEWAGPAVAAAVRSAQAAVTAAVTAGTVAATTAAG